MRRNGNTWQSAMSQLPAWFLQNLASVIARWCPLLISVFLSFPFLSFLFFSFIKNFSFFKLLTMVFSSVPVFLDPPNWPQQPNQLQGNGSSDNNLQLPPPPPPPPSGGGSGGTGSIRPGSMTDRARMAKMPQPEAGLKCPRCDSTNTKFCYFNNYSLTQPRHFCKTCRRYWTRGGAMRNVPVGGGCRRSSKRSSKGSNRSKSPAGSNTSTSTVSSNSCTTDIISHLSAPQPPPHLPFLAPLHHLSDFGNISLNFEGLQIPAMASGDHHHHQSILSNGVNDNQPWKIPFFANLQQQNGLYSSFAGDQDGGDFSNYQGSAATAAVGTGQFRLSKPLDSGFSQLGNNLKMEEAVQGLNLSRNFLGIQGNDQFWSNTTPGNAWTDQISDHFTSSSSTSHLL